MVKRAFSGAYFWCLFGVYFYKNRRKETNVRKVEISKNRMIPPFIAFYKCMQNSKSIIRLSSSPPAASCRSQDAHLIVMGCVVFAPASEADVFGNASQAVPGRTLRSRSVFFCLSAHTQRQGFFCQCVPIESLGTQFAFGAFLA